MSGAARRAAQLGCWRGPVAPRVLHGGISNHNFLVEESGRRYFVRIGDDFPEHNVVRWHELAASRAAAAAGISPRLVHHEPGALVFDFLEGRTLAEEDVQDAAMLERIVPLVARVHREIPRHFRGPLLAFWVFQVLRDYAATLREGAGRLLADVPRLLEAGERLERAVGPVEPVFGHNDLLAANFIDDGERLWVVDWEYAGLNSPLFDLANLASNNRLGPEREEWLLAAYFERTPDDDLRRRYEAMKCASLLRESMWSMVAEIHSALDFDYVAYTGENLERFERALAAFVARWE